jgi:CRP/FNR family cyclic AMP-dependent transcriptional regulator
MITTGTGENHGRNSAMQQHHWYLKNCSLFDRLPEAELTALERHSRMRRFPAKSPVYLPVDAASGVFLLVDGQVKICNLTPEGKQSILTFIEPGELFGELALFQEGRREESAQTTMSSTVVLIDSAALHQTLARIPSLSLGITKLVGMRRLRIERRLKYLLFRSNRERLVHLLLELAEDYGKPLADGTVALGIRLSHQDLASIIGSTRESVTVILGQLQCENLLSLGRRRITIQSLQRLAQSVRAEVPRLRPSLDVRHNLGTNIAGEFST